MSAVPESPVVPRLYRAGQAIVASTVGLIALGLALRMPALAGLAYGGGITTGAITALSWMFLRGRPPNWASAVPVTASAEGLRIGERELVPTSELLEAIVTPRAKRGNGLAPWWARGQAPGAIDRYEVVIRRKGRFSLPIRFSTKTVEEARAIIDTLGLGAGRRAVTRKVASPFIAPKYTFAAIFGGALISGIGAFLAQQVHPAFGVLVAAFPAGFVSTYVFGFIKLKVTIGADGVTTKWLGKPKTIALSDIERVEVVRGHVLRMTAVRLVRKDGTNFDIDIGLRGQNPFEPFVLHEEVERVAERIREAIALGEKAQPFEFRGWAANKSQLPIGDWIRMLRGALDAYRAEGTMPFSADELWSVLTNAQALPAERAAAAVAVSAKLDERTKTRLRDVAASTALPRLRVVLEAAAEGDDALLSSALEEIRAEATPAPELEPGPAIRVRVDDDAPVEPETQAETKRARASAE